MEEGDLKDEMALLFGHGSTCGIRASMEDEVLTIPRFQIKARKAKVKNPLSLFGVYDGHGGDSCARYVSKTLPDVLRQYLEAGETVAEALTKTYEFLDNDFCENGDTSGTTAVTMLLEHTTGTIWVANVGDSRCVMCSIEGEDHAEEVEEQESRRHMPATVDEDGVMASLPVPDNIQPPADRRNSSHSDASDSDISANSSASSKSSVRRKLFKSKKKHNTMPSRSKSTGSVKKKIKKKFTPRSLRKKSHKSRRFPNRTPLEVVPMTRDHRPDDPEEMRRIKQAGGYIWNRRVNGGLAITRAIGDSDFKQADQLNLIIPTPEIEKRQLTELDRFVLLACDGLFDVMENDTVMAFVAQAKEKSLTRAFEKSQTRARRRKKKDWRECLNKICKELAELAVTKGSSDNVSVVIVDLRPSK